MPGGFRARGVLLYLTLHFNFILPFLYSNQTAVERQKMELLMDHLLICQTGVMQVHYPVACSFRNKQFVNRAPGTLPHIPLWTTH